MKVPLVFLIPNEFRHELMFVCPVCHSQAFTPSTTDLSNLRCSHCGTSHNAENADMEILSPNAPRTDPPGHKPRSANPYSHW